ncbi:SAM-dependent methyltransferase [Aurantimonas endophytica]|uniref:Cyclopropane-fatty-acyl-phospholipid synthase n=1 Tax=Aurantimonas endophytica TaxID=1522175 RepID=A0A7W6HH39_9HYPH|nr:cyclopropane-fatty-acyl-phospholipid synthase family protein [Aurantimonas endophytica]MBB4005081.1 cyclopropane-fatty-acyl-phospholipid synthase [Aurantimonas endophytica]MCO6406254.1 methyltransferase domain-containing protein [Aurantimonas endophytica]
MATGEAKLEAIVREAVAAFQPKIAVRLWTGERLGPADGPVLALNDPAALARLAISPRIATAVELWMSRAIDIEGGTIFDVAAARSDIKTRDALKRLDKLKLAAALPALYSLSRQGKRQAVAEAGDGAGASGSSMAAIQFHYDISNDFYRLFLDSRMLYSCAYFDGWHDDIDKAQHDKLDMICRKLRLQPGERFLDIGCGWGALLIHAAEHYGVTGHGVTLSQAQYDLARERIAAKGLADKVTVELKPFQDLSGTFDKIASIGMFEHVGWDNHDAYFKAVRGLLRPKGLYLHHAITRPAKATDAKFRKGTKEYAAIIRYIFPGAELDHVGHSAQMLEKHRFEVHDVENWREHYARTCRLWHDRLVARMDEAAAIAGEERARLWLLYLAGVSLGFERGGLLIYQTLASKRAKGPSGLPPTRRDLYA